ncbi:MAG: HlyD family type I secretion periplasmic adaptor subunit [Cellvibrionaceae bacterium]
MNNEAKEIKPDLSDEVSSQAVPLSGSVVDTSPPKRSNGFVNWLFGRWTTNDEPDIVEWHDDVANTLIEQQPIKTRSLLYTMCFAVIALFIWSTFAEIDEVTRGEGKVIPSQQVQIVQSLDGGVLMEILVKEGQIVEQDQLLFRLDKTRFASSLREKEIERLALLIRAERLQAITEGSAFEVDEEVYSQVPDVYEQEKILYKNSLAELDAGKNIALQQLSQRQEEYNEVRAKISQLNESYRLASQELRMTKPLVNSGAVSEVELLRLEREVANLKGELNQASAQQERISAAITEAKGKIEEVELAFKNQRREELSQVTARINSLRESNLGLSDMVKQTSIRSPVRGTVNRLFFNTLGGVVLPGKEVVEIVPLDDTLLLEARIRPQDIAFLTYGQKALVKFTAYDFVVYGGLDAVVEQIGADTLMDEDGNPYYNVRVRTLESSLGEDKPIIPGMVAEVDILTGKKTIFEYLIKPVLRAKQYALTER